MLTAQAQRNILNTLYQCVTTQSVTVVPKVVSLFVVLVERMWKQQFED